MKKTVSLLTAALLTLNAGTAFAWNNGRDFEYVQPPEGVETLWESGWKSVWEADGGYLAETVDGSVGLVNEDMELIRLNRYVSFDDEAGLYCLYDGSGRLYAQLDGAFQVNEWVEYITAVKPSEDLFLIYRKSDGQETARLALSRYDPAGVWDSSSLDRFRIFGDGHFVFANGEKKLGLADATGQTVLEPVYDTIRTVDGLEDGKELYFVYQGEKHYIIEPSGRVLAQLDEVNWVDGFGKGADGEPMYRAHTWYGKELLLDGSFRECLDTGDLNPWNRSDGALLMKDRNTGLYGLMDLTGTLLLPAVYSDAEFLGGGFMRFRHAEEPDNDIITDETGKTLIENCRYYTSLGSDGLLGVSAPDFEGYIDLQGSRVVTVPEGWYVQEGFSEGKAAVVTNLVYNRYGKVAYIDLSGNILFEGDDNWCYGGMFRHDTALVGVQLGKGGASYRRMVRYTRDTPSDWASDAVEQAKEKGFLPQELAGKYRYGITREEFCLLCRDMLERRRGAALETGETPFTDTDSSAAVSALYTAGIIRGKSDTVFDPDALITREEAATILDAAFRFLGLEEAGEDETFSDSGEISDWAARAVSRMSAAGILQGVGDGRFSPKGSYTREQAVMTMLRLYDAE